MSNELGLRNVMFEVDDLDATLEELAGDGYGLVGGVGQHEDIWRMAYVRGPEGIIVALAQRIDG
jgi:catechol 2,3-dioxygenase-like lactoylglutathione lyase family enzyme